MSAAVQASPLNRLAANLEELGLEGMASSVPEYVRLVADGRKGLVDAMLELTDAQIALKRRADDERRTRMANFPYIKTLADFDWGFQPSVPRGLVEQLATLEFIDRGDNVVLVGSPGVGKTHLSIAIGHEAVRPASRCTSPTARGWSRTSSTPRRRRRWRAGCGSTSTAAC